MFTPAVRCPAIWRSGPPGVPQGSQGVSLPTLMPAPAVPNPLDLVSLAPVTHQPVIAILWGHKATTLNPLLDSTGLFFCFFPRLTIDNVSFIDLFAATKTENYDLHPKESSNERFIRFLRSFFCNHAPLEIRGSRCFNFHSAHGKVSSINATKGSVQKPQLRKNSAKGAGGGPPLFR